MRLISPVDGLDRLAAARMLDDFPISIIATTTVSAALADWREQTRFLIAVAALFVLLIAGLLFLVVRKLSQQHRLEKQRLDTAVNNIPQGLIVDDNAAHRGLQPPLYRDVRVVGRRGQAGLQHAGPDCPPQGNRIIRWRCRGVLRRHHPQSRLGKATNQITAAPGGRAIQIINQPLKAGGWVATIEDVTEREQAEARITPPRPLRCADRFAEPGAVPRTAEAGMTRIAPGEQLAVLYIDIDEFKSVNDTLGHLIGDELLKSVAKSLSRCARGDGFVARLGGDEFAIVQTDDQVRGRSHRSRDPDFQGDPRARTSASATRSPPTPASASRWRRSTAPICTRS